MEAMTKEAAVQNELLVGSFISRKTNRKVRIVRVADSHIYRGYINGTLTVEGTRRECMALAQI